MLRPPVGLDQAESGHAGGEGHEARGHEHGRHVGDADDAADERPDGHAGDLAAVDGGEGTAPAVGGDRSGDHGQGGDGRGTGTESLDGAQADQGDRSDRGQEGEAGRAVGHEAAHQHGTAAEAVGHPPDGVLGDDSGGEEGGHDHAGQRVGAAEAPDVDGQHGHDGRRPQPLQEDGDGQRADEPRHGRVGRLLGVATRPRPGVGGPAGCRPGVGLAHLDLVGVRAATRGTPSDASSVHCGPHAPRRTPATAQ